MSKTEKHIIFCSTSFADYDRRMQRITRALQSFGYKISWISRRYEPNFKLNFEVTLIEVKPFFKRGILFYLEYNIRLFLKLLRFKGEAIYSAVDLDTIAATALAGRLKRNSIVFDAHELFYEVPELKGKPFKRFIWLKIALSFIPWTTKSYTVNKSLKLDYEKRFSTPFNIIRNVPSVFHFTENRPTISRFQKSLVYLGVLNVGRGIEIAIEALTQLTDYNLHLIGEGDMSDSLRDLVREKKVEDRVHFHGYVSVDKVPSELQKYSIGLNILDAQSENYRLSLANKFFDYMHADLPSINMAFPEYENILTLHEAGLMINEYRAEDLVDAIRRLEEDDFYNSLVDNCKKFKSFYTWEEEQKKLKEIYDSV